MRPVALDQQARELLRAGAVEAALQLALVCFDQGGAWAETALVEVALLLLQGKGGSPRICLNDDGKKRHVSGGRSGSTCQTSANKTPLI